MDALEREVTELKAALAEARKAAATEPLLREIADLKAALGKVPPHSRAVHSVTSGSVSSGYELFVFADKLPDHIDPRDNVARALCGTRASNFLFGVFKSRAFLAYASIALPLSCACIVLSIPGIYSFLGWGTLPCWPNIFAFLALHNVPMLRKVVDSFGFKALAALIAFVVGVWLDAVRFEAPRVAAVATAGLALLVGLLGDARRPVEAKHSRAVVCTFTLVVMGQWAIIILYCKHPRRHSGGTRCRKPGREEVRTQC